MAGLSAAGGGVRSAGGGAAAAGARAEGVGVLRACGAHPGAAALAVALLLVARVRRVRGLFRQHATNSSQPAAGLACGVLASAHAEDAKASSGL